VAHRFDESEILKFNDNRDIPISIDVLGVSEYYENEENFNKNIEILIERGTLNSLFN